ncbi:VOC family protein [Streptomyces sp. NPDC050504]|uniref:VOC family protein n=1 Tax=Streptomyces sp. NPDC050504 TaxID=3365618 RepID=UPI003788A2AB
MIAELECVALDCPDPLELADFYRRLLGGTVNKPDPRWSTDDDWVTLHSGSDSSGTVLPFQRAADFRAPDWPDPELPQQFHLDLTVRDLDTAHRAVLDIGARLLDDGSEAADGDGQGGGGERGWRVYADPAGHPFCLVRG